MNCRSLGISEQRYYRWQREYSDLNVGQTKLPKELESENFRFRKAMAALRTPHANVASWHKDDLHPAAPEGPITNGFWTLGAEGLLSGGKPTIFVRALKVGT